MRTFFALKTKMPYDPHVLEHMKKTATELLCDVEGDAHTQAIVLYSATGNTYGTVVKDACSREMTEEKSMLAGLRAAGDTQIRYLLCMWRDGGVDIPSLAFRRMTVELDPQNAAALLLVMTAEGASAISVGETMK